MTPPADRSGDAGPWQQLRVRTCYTWRHRRGPCLTGPTRFSELVQLRKLYDRDPRLPQLMDKLAAKAHVADTIGRDWITPTLWSGSALPPVLPFACPAMVKARHGCNQNAVMRAVPGRHAWAALRSQAARWTRRPYGRWLDEWAYRDVPRGILAEPLLGDGVAPPVDYKVYVFGGRATHVQVHLGRGARHRWILHDRDWRPLEPGGERPPRPAALGAMLAAAETLGCGYGFLRVDFYQIGGRPRFGEFCVYPGSGLDRFAADWIDRDLGALWLDAARPAAILPAPAYTAGRRMSAGS